MADVKFDTEFDGSGFAQGVRAITGHVQTLDSKLGNVGNTIRGALSIATVTTFAASMLREAERLEKASKSLGISAEQLQTIEFSVLRARGNPEDVASALVTLERRIEIAAKGGNAYSKALDDLGISLGEVATVTTAELLPAIGKGLKETGNFEAVTQLLDKGAAASLRSTLLELGEAYGKVGSGAQESVGATNAQVEALAKQGELFDILKRKIFEFGAAMADVFIDTSLDKRIEERAEKLAIAANAFEQDSSMASAYSKYLPQTQGRPKAELFMDQAKAEIGQETAHEERQKRDAEIAARAARSQARLEEQIASEQAEFDDRRRSAVERVLKYETEILELSRRRKELSGDRADADLSPAEKINATQIDFQKLQAAHKLIEAQDEINLKLQGALSIEEKIAAKKREIAGLNEKFRDLLDDESRTAVHKSIRIAQKELEDIQGQIPKPKDVQPAFESGADEFSRMGLFLGGDVRQRQLSIENQMLAHQKQIAELSRQYLPAIAQKVNSGAMP